MKAVVHLQLSDSAKKFLMAALDLLEAVEDSDAALVSEGVRDAAEVLRNVIDNAAEGGL